LKGFLAVDIGASGGKAFIGRYDGDRLSIEEVSRFTNRPISVNGRTHWNILSLYESTLESIIKAIDSGVELQSVGVDHGGGFRSAGRLRRGFWAIPDIIGICSAMIRGVRHR
jgi:rhamnulokinase